MTNNDVSCNCFCIEEPPVNIEAYEECRIKEIMICSINSYCTDTSTWD